MSREPQGKFLGMPYNWSKPKRQDLKRSLWDPDERRVLQPKTYGWGYDVNLHALARRLRGR